MDNALYFAKAMNAVPKIEMLPVVFEELTAITGKLSLDISRLDWGGSNTPWSSRFDAVLEAGDWTFFVEFTKQFTSESIAGVAHRWDSLVQNVPGRQTTPLLVVPYMGVTGRTLCRAADINWIDLSGNAEIHLPGLHVVVSGRANQFKRQGRPKSLFAPATSRIARALLLEPEGFTSQKDLANVTDLSESWVSRSVRRFEEAGFLERKDRIRLNPSESRRLIDQWRLEYDFFGHEVHRAHMAVRNSEEILHLVSGRLIEMSIRHAATGLGAAWLYSGYAAFRTVTYYLQSLPSAEDMPESGFRWVESGANLWLVIPNDEGVYMGMKEMNGIRCVSPLQTYLDLKQHPERSKEAAEHVRAQFLGITDE